MADLFREQNAHNDESFREMMMHLLTEKREQRWAEREEEAKCFISEYIDKHPEALKGAITTFPQIDRMLMGVMELYRDHYLAELESDDHTELDDFKYARGIAILGAVRWLIREVHEEEGSCFIHLCDRGCEAVHSIMDHEKE